MRYGTSSCWTGLDPSSGVGPGGMLACSMAPVHVGLTNSGTEPSEMLACSTVPVHVEPAWIPVLVLIK